MTSVSQSADKAYFGKLTRFCNRYLRYVLVLRALGMSSSDKGNPMRETCWRVFFRSKANHAKIAVARQLTRVICRMLKSSSDWEPSKITDRRELSASRKVGTQTCGAVEQVGRNGACNCYGRPTDCRTGYCACLTADSLGKCSRFVAVPPRIWWVRCRFYLRYASHSGVAGHIPAS